MPEPQGGPGASSPAKTGGYGFQGSRVESLQRAGGLPQGPESGCGWPTCAQFWTGCGSSILLTEVGEKLGAIPRSGGEACGEGTRADSRQGTPGTGTLTKVTVSCPSRRWQSGPSISVGPESGLYCRKYRRLGGCCQRAWTPAGGGGECSLT